MGLDSYLLVAQSKKELQSDTYWKTVSENHFQTFMEEEPVEHWEGEWWYARKFYDCHQYIVDNLLNGEYENGDYVPMTYEMVEKILQYCCKHHDYFGGFQTVTKLCELLYHWHELEEKHLQVFYECDW